MRERARRGDRAPIARRGPLGGSNAALACVLLSVAEQASLFVKNVRRAIQQHQNPLSASDSPLCYAGDEAPLSNAARAAATLPAPARRGGPFGFAKPAGLADASGAPLEGESTVGDGEALLALAASAAPKLAEWAGPTGRARPLVRIGAGVGSEDDRPGWAAADERDRTDASSERISALVSEAGSDVSTCKARRRTVSLRIRRAMSRQKRAMGRHLLVDLNTSALLDLGDQAADAR
jgi:hypothetical protein